MASRRSSGTDATTAHVSGMTTTQNQGTAPTTGRRLAELRRSNAAGKHSTGTRRLRSRTAQRQHAIRDSGDGR